MLDDLLHQEALDIHFQPILSLKSKVLVGLEALARPHTMSVMEMFQQAADANRILDVDRLCRRKAMEEYGSLTLPIEPRPLLFFNFEASIIDQGVVGSRAILTAVQLASLEPSDVVIEINESKVIDTEALKYFVDYHRNLGFIIALDDLGAGHSNLPRIAQLRPHIIKLDRALISCIDCDFFKQETMKSMINLCNNIGSLALVEGVESAAEVDTCANLGATLFQGFYFGRPQSPCDLDLTALRSRLQEDARRLRSNSVRTMQARRLEGSYLNHLMDECCNLLSQSDPSDFDTVLAKLARRGQNIEACYLLDHDGLQISVTHLGYETTLPCSRLFVPASRGTDHSNKEYCFSILDAGFERYTTDIYISMATGNFCRTVTVLLKHPCNRKYVLCIDLNVHR